MAAEPPFVLAGKPAKSPNVLDVVNPFDGAPVGRTWLAGDAEFDQAADAAVAAAGAMRRFPACERAGVLTRTSAELVARKDEIARRWSSAPGCLPRRSACCRWRGRPGIDWLPTTGSNS